MKFDLSCCPSLSQRMSNMCAVIQCRQIPDQPQPPDWSPTHIFDQSIAHLGIGGDHHGATGKFTVAKSEKEAGTSINLIFPIHSQGKWPAFHPRQADKNRRLVSQLSPTLKPPGTQRRYIGRESHTQQIDVVNNSPRMPETQNVALTRTPSQQRFYAEFHSAVSEVAQE